MLWATSVFIYTSKAKLPHRSAPVPLHPGPCAWPQAGLTLRATCPARSRAPGLWSRSVSGHQLCCDMTGHAISCLIPSRAGAAGQDKQSVRNRQDWEMQQSPMESHQGLLLGTATWHPRPATPGHPQRCSRRARLLSTAPLHWAPSDPACSQRFHPTIPACSHFWR